MMVLCAPANIQFGRLDRAPELGLMVVLSVRPGSNRIWLSVNCALDRHRSIGASGFIGERCRDELFMAVASR